MKIFQNKIGSFSISLFLQNEALNPILPCQTAIFPAITFRPFIHLTKRGLGHTSSLQESCPLLLAGEMLGRKAPNISGR